ncbi:MAG: hypothetical protein GY810_13235 [Aureispira sp.]|nr:hypothetical protein [Aureispira sp.]
MNFSMRTNGKLLLTGEYFVTEGAVALALPTNLGQELSVTSNPEGEAATLHWDSCDSEGNVWFSAKFELPKMDILEVEEDKEMKDLATNLQDLLKAARALNSKFLKSDEALYAKTTLEFPRDWGLGSSSTLVTMVAQWADVDPFELLEKTFGGSGYDLVAATADGPLLFQKFNGKNRWDKSGFNPSFKEQLYFVHLGKKQSSKEALVYYMVTPPDEREKPMGRITQITYDIAKYTDSLEQFEELIAEHEELVQSIIKHPRAKEEYFGDYWGEVKSLGAWGGDFVLATSDRSEDETKAYFQGKGFETVLTYSEMIKEYE